MGKMKVTTEKVSRLLKGYHEEPRFLLHLLMDEQQKRPVNQKAIQAIKDELLLFDLLFDAVMSLKSSYKCFIIMRYLSGEKLSLRELSEHLECDASTLARWNRDAIKSITKFINEKLNRKDGDNDETDCQTESFL